MKDNNSVEIIEGNLEPIKVYKVYEQELDILEKGRNMSLYLTFSLWLLAIAFSANFGYLSIENPNSNTIAFIFSIMFLGYIFSVLLFFLWLKGRKSHQKTLQKIKSRIKEQSNQE